MSIYNTNKKELIVKPILWGSIASILLLSIYLVILTIANSFSHSIQQFLELWYWMTPIVLGFGLQVGLFIYVNKYAKIRAKNAMAGSSVATAGGISAASMIACCAHHITDILPILGLSAAALFLNKYQYFFLALGVVSNLIGINIMLNIIQKHQLYSGSNMLEKMMKINMKYMLYINTAIGLFILILAYTL